MELSEHQVEQYHRDGFLIFPNLFSTAEVETLRAEADRLAGIESDLVKRERTGAVRQIFRVHENNGPTQSAGFRALSRTPRAVKPAMQLLDDEKLYIFHTKLNLKPAIEGSIWAWHQDYGSWEKDGLPTENVTTLLVMLDDAEEIGGALYFIPGSHRGGGLHHVEDFAVGALNQYSVNRPDLVRILKECGKPTPVIGKAGTAAIFHANIVHGSGHNMSASDRRQLYVVYNPVANKVRDVPNPRGDHVRSVNFAPIAMVEETAILTAAGVADPDARAA